MADGVKSDFDLSEIISLILEEDQISEYKKFYKTHLMGIRNREQVLLQLDSIVVKFKQESKSINAMMFQSQYSLDYEAKEFLKKHFNEKILSLYNDVPKAKKEFSPPPSLASRE